MRPVRAEIDLGAIEYNIREIRHITETSAKVMAVVKANAYGHGAIEVSKTVLNNGADWLGVALLQEAIQLRESGFTAPILILGYTPVYQMNKVIEYDLRQTIYTKDQAEALASAAAKAGKKGLAHIKVDTGMGRIGIPLGSHVVNELIKLGRMPGLVPEGIFTHFATADAVDKACAKQQFESFIDVLEKLKRKGMEFPVRHAANSAALIDLPDTHLDLVRPGVIIYGMYPSDKVCKDKINLKQAMTVAAEVSYVKKVTSGTAISYGGTFITQVPSVIASLPLGYADGYSRILSNKAQVLIKGQRVPIVGRVCMDQCMVDVTNLGEEIRMGEEAVLLGAQGPEFISADEIAARIGTINYEVTCMISHRVPRTYTRYQ